MICWRCCDLIDVEAGEEPATVVVNGQPVELHAWPCAVWLAADLEEATNQEPGEPTC